MKTTLLILIFLIQNLFSQWQLTNGVGTGNGNTLYNINDDIYAGTDFSAYKSTNSGDDWAQINNGMPPNPKVYDYANLNGTIYCAIYPERKIYYSTNEGGQWNPTNQYPSNSWSQNVAVTSGYLISGTDDYVYWSTNNGDNWTKMDQGVYPTNIRGIEINGNTIYSGTRYSGVFVSFLGGNSWTRINGELTGNQLRINELRFANNKLYIVTDAGIFISTNNGTNWVNAYSTLGTISIWSLAVLNSNILIGTETKIYFSSNDGSNWSDITAGLPANPKVTEIAYNSTYAFAMLQSGAVYKLPLSQIIGIQPISTEIPKQFSLSQNYPNPFNPVTNINFDITSKSNVKLSVFNSLGQEVTTLVDQELTPGTYKVDWNASNYPSGVYYYKITAGDFNDTKKMILIK